MSNKNMSDVNFNIISSNYVTLFDKILITRNDQINLRYQSSNKKVSEEPLDMIVAMIESDNIINALCVIRDKTIVKLLTRTDIFIQQLLTFMNVILNNNLYITLDNLSDSEINILTNLGFTSPNIIDGKVNLYKILSPSPSYTQLEIKRLEP